jgi:sugar lactone lactonase YvrE
VFIQGAAIHGANGLAVDASGNLLVASVFGGELVALDSRTGKILERLGHATGVDGPDDVAVGPDGSIYWTDILLGEVGRLEPDGMVTKQFVAPGMNPIAFKGARLFVGQAFMGDGLYELDPDLVDPPRVVIPDSGVPPFGGQLNGFDFGPDGMLYSPQPFLGRIVRIDPETGAMAEVTDAFAADPPTSVEFDSRGRLYASLSGGSIVRVDAVTGAYRLVTKIRDAVLDNMVFDARDRLFVSNSDDGSVYAVAPGGGVRTLIPGGLILPGGIALMEGASGRESLFVADLWSLAEFDARSGRLLDVDRQSRAGGGIVEPWTVSPDGGNVIITSWMSNAVQIWDPAAGEEVRIFADPNLPMNAIRFQGELVVAELAPGSVVCLKEDGTKSPITTDIYYPTGLAATDDDLWVADWATGIVWKIVADGAILSTPQFIAGGFLLPEGMAVDRDGSLLVVEAGAGRLSRIDPAGNVTTVADGLELGVQGSAGAPPTLAMSSVAVERDGTIFVTGDLANVVYRLRPLPASR